MVASEFGNTMTKSQINLALCIGIPVLYPALWLRILLLHLSSTYYRYSEQPVLHSWSFGAYRHILFSRLSYGNISTRKYETACCTKCLTSFFFFHNRLHYCLVLPFPNAPSNEYIELMSDKQLIQHASISDTTDELWQSVEEARTNIFQMHIQKLFHSVQRWIAVVTGNRWRLYKIFISS